MKYINRVVYSKYITRHKQFYVVMTLLKGQIKRQLLCEQATSIGSRLHIHVHVHMHTHTHTSYICLLSIEPVFLFSKPGSSFDQHTDLE